MATSRPPTPPPRLPERGESRFTDITLPCEWVESYHPGGLHPVDVGDVLGDDGRYKILRKLGYGSFSTVWLARDLTKEDGARQRIVAIKVVVASAGPTANLTEVTLYRHLASVDENVDQHVTKLLDTFSIIGPNGTHAGLVFEPMGPTVNSMVEWLPQFVPRKGFMEIRYPFWMAKQILRGTVRALSLLHGHGLAHGDLQPGNVLFTLRDNLDSCTDDELQAFDVKTLGTQARLSTPVERLDGKADLWAPKQLYVALPMADRADTGPGFAVKLSDLGGAYLSTQPPAELIMPSGLRAPELILKTKAPSNILDGRALDIWSVGCLVFELVTGQALFCNPWAPGETDDEHDDGHLLQLVTVLGQNVLDDAAWACWTRSSLYFRRDESGQRTLFNIGVGENEPLIRPEDAHPWSLLTMEEMFDQLVPEYVGEEALETKRLIRRILQRDPAQRPTAKEILQDPWFDGDGTKGSD